MAQAPRRRGERLPLPPTPPEGGPDDLDYVYRSPEEQRRVQPYYSCPMMAPEVRRYRMGSRQMMDPRESETPQFLEDMKRQPRRLKKGGPVKKYEGGGMVEIEIKVSGGKGKHKMPDGTMMDDDEMESEEYKKGGKVGGKKFIQNAIKKPGALRAQLGAKEGQKIPPKKLAAAAKAPGKLGQRARFAQTLGKMRKK